MGAWALLLAVVLLASPSQAAVQTVPGGGEQPSLGRTCTSFFRIKPYLTHVTTTAIRVNVIPEDSFDLRWSVSLATDNAWGVRGIVVQSAATADTRTHGVAAPNPTFTGLVAGTAYKYQVECRTNAASPWQLVQRATFRTLRTNTADVYKVAVMGDSHTYQFYSFAFSGADAGVDRRPNPLNTIQLTLKNLQSSGADFMVDLGDTQMTDWDIGLLVLGTVTYTRENGTVVTLPALIDDDPTSINLAWEIWASFWQPAMAFMPYFQGFGNHEGIHGFGGVGAARVCGYSENNTAANLVGAQFTLGNFNDAYPNGSDANNFDGDTSGVGAETQTDGLYYEFASGSMRWFNLNTTRYREDACSGCADVAAASLYPGFIARTADTPNPGVGASPPSNAWPDNNTDTLEDNLTLGATQVGWLVTRAAAKTETFGAVMSHTAIAGYADPELCYYYSRGILATQKDGSGRRTTATAFDPDGDGDLSEDHYLDALMTAEDIQIRFMAHDHAHVICRKNGNHYIEVGVMQGAIGVGNSPSLYWANSDAVLRDIYDCDEDGKQDFDPEGLYIAGPGPQPIPMKRTVQNQGIAGANGTTNPGYGLLTVNGTTNLTWRWVVSDTSDPVRNNDTILTYGPIVP